MGAVEKQTTFSHRSPQRLENSPTAREFPTVPTVTTTGPIKQEESDTTALFFQPLLHFQIESAIFLLPFVICHFPCLCVPV